MNYGVADYAHIVQTLQQQCAEHGAPEPILFPNPAAR